MNWVKKILQIHMDIGKFCATCYVYRSELGASHFEIAQLLFALKRTMILEAMALNEKKSEERRMTSKLTKSKF